MKYIFILSFFLFGLSCNKSEIANEKFKLKPGAVNIETLNQIIIKLKDKGAFNTRNEIAITSAQNTELEISKIIQPLVINGRQLHNELITYVSNTNEWAKLSDSERKSIFNMSDLEFANLSIVYSAAQALNKMEDAKTSNNRRSIKSLKIDISSAIHDCVGVALGIYGIKGLLSSLVTGPSVSTAIGILKWAGKRYLSYIGIAWMIWDFSSCMSNFPS
jgi:hypothetical protein